MLNRPEKSQIELDPAAGQPRSGEAGFSLIEVAVAMVVVLIALLGVFFTLTYAITYNAGNNSRAQALAVLQEEVERFGRELERLRAEETTRHATIIGLSGYGQEQDREHRAGRRLHGVDLLLEMWMTGTPFRRLMGRRAFRPPSRGVDAKTSPAL